MSSYKWPYFARISPVIKYRHTIGVYEFSKCLLQGKSIKMWNITITSVLLIFSVFMDIRFYSIRNGRLVNFSEAMQCHHPDNLYFPLYCVNVYNRKGCIFSLRWSLELMAYKFIAPLVSQSCSEHTLGVFRLSHIWHTCCISGVMLAWSQTWECWFCSGYTAGQFLAIAFPSMHTIWMNYSTMISSNCPVLTGV